MSFGRRDFIKLASGLLLPYEPKRIYSFPSSNVVYSSTAPLLVLVHQGGAMKAMEYEGFIEGSHSFSVKVAPIKPIDRITVDFDIGK